MFNKCKVRLKNYRLILMLFSVVILASFQLKSLPRTITPVSISNVNISQKLNKLLKKICDPTNLKISSECSKDLRDFDEKLDYLYNLNNKDDCSQCVLNEKKEIVYIYYHTFWKLGSSPSNYEFRVLKLNLMSYLATQNLCCTRFFFWKLTTFPQNIEDDLRKEFKFYIDKNIVHLRVFSMRKLCPSSTIFKDHDTCKNKNIDNAILTTNSVGLSDFLRFFVLEQFGGIYTDGDVIYLKNMQLLWYFNFAYRWSFTSMVNTAVLGINRRFDSSIDSLYREILTRVRNGHSLLGAFHPNEVSRHMCDLNNNSIYNFKPLETLHGYLFDPAWLCYDGIEKSLNLKSVCNFEQFSKTKLVEKTEFNSKDFFPGAFNYHIHLKNADVNVISTESYMAYFEEYFRSILRLN